MPYMFYISILYLPCIYGRTDNKVDFDLKSDIIPPTPDVQIYVSLWSLGNHGCCYKHFWKRPNTERFNIQADMQEEKRKKKKLFFCQEKSLLSCQSKQIILSGYTNKITCFQKKPHRCAASYLKKKKKKGWTIILLNIKEKNIYLLPLPIEQSGYIRQSQSFENASNVT